MSPLLGIDGTDPANLIVYAGDDPSALGTAGVGRWFQTTQTSAAPGPPGTPLDVIATGGGVLPTATVSWSPAQVAQPLTSYTVHNSFASNGLLLSDVLVAPLAGGFFPPTSTSINVAQNVAYQFQVSAGNAQGSSPLSASSNVVPLGRGNSRRSNRSHSRCGRHAGFCLMDCPVNSNGALVTSYTVTALVNGLPSGISSTIAAPATSSVNTVISGLTTARRTASASMPPVPEEMDRSRLLQLQLRLRPAMCRCYEIFWYLGRLPKIRFRRLSRMKSSSPIRRSFRSRMWL